MTPIEAAKLQRSGLCCLDDVVMHLTPIDSWGEVFVAVDRVSRDGGLLLRQLGYLTYQIVLRPQVAYPVQRLVAEEESASQSLEC